MTYGAISVFLSPTHLHTSRWRTDDLRYEPSFPGRLAPRGGSVPGINIQIGPRLWQALHGDGLCRNTNS